MPGSEPSGPSERRTKASERGTAATRPGGRSYLKVFGLSGWTGLGLAYVAGPIANRPDRTNGNPGGKLPRGNRAIRSPALRYSAASRNAPTNQR